MLTDHDRTDDRSSSRPSSYAWFVVALLLPVALLNYLDRQMLAAMKPSITADISDIATKAHWGIVLGAFKWVYAVLSPIGGYIADRTSRRHVIVGSLIVWSAATCGTAIVTTFPQLVAARAVMGVSEAFYFPAALSLIVELHTAQTRSRAVAVHQMGVYLGVILGGFAGYVAAEPSLGWRWAFAVCGAAGVIYALPLFGLLGNPPRASGPESSSMLSSVRELTGNTNFRLLVAYFTLPALAGWVVRDWMPDVLRERLGLGEGQAGVSAVLYVQLASLVGVGLGGWLADRWMKRSIRGRIFASALGVSFFMPALFGVGDAQTIAEAVGFLILFGLGWGFFDCNNMPILCQIARPELRATGYGIMNLVSIACGGFADWGFGALRDSHVSLMLTFGIFAAAALLSIGLVLMIRPSEPQTIAARNTGESK
jgi:MFS transporter, Spinster family, sphingosine-1-phosphate transporter